MIRHVRPWPARRRETPSVKSTSRRNRHPCAARPPAGIALGLVALLFDKIAASHNVRDGGILSP